VNKPWRLVGTAAIAGVLAWRLDWSKVAAAFATLDARLWWAALGVYFVAQIASSLRWQLLAGALGLGGSLVRYTAYYFIGMFFNLVLPTSVGGDVVRAWYLSRQGGSGTVTGPRTAAFLSVLVDRANGLAVLIVVACVALACYAQPLPRWVTLTVAAMGLATLAAVVAVPFLPRLEKHLPKKLQQVATGTGHYLRRPGLLVGVSLLSLIVQLANIVLAWFIGVGLGLEVPLAYCCVLISVVSVLTLLPISVNGMGLREAGTVVLLAPLGVGAAEAVTLSLLIFAVQATASLCGSLVYLFGRFPRFEAAASLAAEPVEVPADVHAVRGDPYQGRARQPPAAA
jgi:uncharacterized membrane protein YbhN (UPF0104 family)